MGVVIASGTPAPCGLCRRQTGTGYQSCKGTLQTIDGSLLIFPGCLTCTISFLPLVGPYLETLALHVQCFQKQQLPQNILNWIKRSSSFPGKKKKKRVLYVCVEHTLPSASFSTLSQVPFFISNDAILLKLLGQC